MGIQQICNNTVVGHEHMFFEDGTDAGYSSDGIYCGEEKGKFSDCEDIGLSKKEVRDTIEFIKDDFHKDDYDVQPRGAGGNNCQDFVDAIKWWSK